MAGRSGSDEQFYLLYAHQGSLWPGGEGQTGAWCGAGLQKVLLHYGGGSAVRSGLLDRVKDSLREAGLEWTELGALPTRGSPWCGRAWTCAGGRGGLPSGRRGGSVIDSAKAMA